MDNITLILSDIANSLKRIAVELEKSNNMIKDLGAKND